MTHWVTLDDWDSDGIPLSVQCGCPRSEDHHAGIPDECGECAAATDDTGRCWFCDRAAGRIWEDA